MASEEEIKLTPALHPIICQIWAKSRFTYTYIEGFEKSLKLVWIALNIAGMKNIGVKKQSIGTFAISKSVDNLKKANSSLELKNECMEKNLKENHVIVDTLITKKEKKLEKVGQRKFELIEENIRLLTFMFVI